MYYHRIAGTHSPEAFNKLTGMPARKFFLQDPVNHGQYYVGHEEAKNLFKYFASKNYPMTA